MEDVLKIINENSPFIIVGLLIIMLLLFIIVIYLIRSINKLEKKYRRMMRGVNNKNLEELISSKLDEIDKAMEFSNEALNKCRGN